MKTSRSVGRCTAIFLLLSAALLGQAQDMVPLNLRFERVNLSNGRVLKDAALTSINRGSDLVYVLENRKLKPYPRALFPGFVTARIADQLEEYPAPKSSSERKPSTYARVSPSSQSKSDPIGSPERNAADRAAIEAAVAAKAESAALRHFRYGQRTGSGYTTTTQSEVELGGPQPIPGWPGRYRVEGTAYYSYYESVGTTFNNRRRGVEVIVEAQSPSRVKVLEVNTDWTPNR
ncbi:MAG: hypothetical protein HOH58_02875 [Opitutaceae bacterium]|nr:hypothetical protein [Opitutaceae bacterium]